jgi:serine/threonine-protein kinase
LNVWVTDTMPGLRKVLDFGVSTLIGASGTLTQGAIIGTPAYMAPEQARSEEVDARCDVYALGAVIYRALTGVAPFRAATPAKILYDVEYRVPTRPSQLLPSLPSAVDAALGIALAKSRADRFDSTTEFGEAFAEAAAGRLSFRWESRADHVRSRYPWGARIHPVSSDERIASELVKPDTETAAPEAQRPTLLKPGSDEESVV